MKPLLLLTLLAAPALGQDPAQAPGETLTADESDSASSQAQRIARREQRRSLNRLDLVVNDECLTRMDVMRDALQRGRVQLTPDELRERMAQVMDYRVKSMLKTQAGEDLGFEPAMVNRLVKDELDRKEERAGGPARLGDALKDFAVDSGAFYESTESDILEELWLRSVEGRFPGPGGRNYVDRYVRPGRLKFEYERNKSALVSGPATVTLQEIAVDAQLIGDLGEARAHAEDLLARILDGEDFGTVAVEGGAADAETKGVLQPLEEQVLAGIPYVGDFVATAEVGAVSDVLPIRLDGVLRGFRVLKLLAVERPEPPPFEDQAFQSELTRRIQDSMDEGRAQAALARLFDAAYVWPPEAFGRAQPQPVQGPPAPAGPARAPARGPTQQRTGSAGTR